MSSAGPGLGRFEYCLNVKDLDASREFYGKLGFEPIGGDADEGWAILSDGKAVIGLYAGHIGENLMNFRRGDVFAIAAALKERGLELEKDAHVEPDGSAGATIRDPDGNLIYFNTHPDENGSRDE